MLTMGVCDGATQSERWWSFPVTAFDVVSMDSRGDLQPLLAAHSQALDDRLKSHTVGQRTSTLPEEGLLLVVLSWE